MSCLTSSADIFLQFTKHSVFSVRKNLSATALSSVYLTDGLFTIEFSSILRHQAQVSTIQEGSMGTKGRKNVKKPKKSPVKKQEEKKATK